MIDQPMIHPGDDDPLMVNIRKAADLIRYICTFTDTHGADAWSKRQLISMLAEVKHQSENILAETGIADLKAHFEDVWSDLVERRSAVTGDGTDWRPFTEIEEQPNG